MKQKAVTQVAARAMTADAQFLGRAFWRDPNDDGSSKFSTTALGLTSYFALFVHEAGRARLLLGLSPVGSLSSNSTELAAIGRNSVKRFDDRKSGVIALLNLHRLQVIAPQQNSFGTAAEHPDPSSIGDLGLFDHRGRSF